MVPKTWIPLRRVGDPEMLALISEGVLYGIASGGDRWGYGYGFRAQASTALCHASFSRLGLRHSWRAFGQVGGRLSGNRLTRMRQSAASMGNVATHAFNSSSVISWPLLRLRKVLWHVEFSKSGSPPQGAYDDEGGFPWLHVRDSK
jgi:hypothetical protein